MCNRIFAHKYMMKHTYETEAKTQEQSIELWKGKSEDTQKDNYTQYQ